jgi:hypothetical protein
MDEQHLAAVGIARRKIAEIGQSAATEKLTPLRAIFDQISIGEAKTRDRLKPLSKRPEMPADTGF